MRETPTESHSGEGPIAARSVTEFVPAEALLALESLLSDPATGSLEATEKLTYEHFRDLLAGRIRTLLERRRELLFSILYRIDVSERAVKSVIASAATEDIPHHLADLVIERQLQKMETRRRYRERSAR